GPKAQVSRNDLKGPRAPYVKMGGMEGIMGMLPGMGKMKSQMDQAGFDDKVIRRQMALIDSMTKRERANPQILQASRKKRIAAGAGMEVSDLNKLLKMHRQMADMMKKMGKMGKKGMMRQMGAMFGGKGGMPGMGGGMPSQAEIEAAQKQLGQMPGGLPGMPGGGAQLPPGLSGFGKKK
ncbi:MAG: signal recognition particle protein, partial [Boseongicola sp.]|nr:signal recognition particle protein [Boseongicola sp.]